MFMNWLKKAPTPVIVAVVIMCGVLALGVLAAFVVLTLQGVDTTEFRQWINTIGQILVYPFLGVSTLAAVSGARSAKAAEENTNGHLAEKDQKIETLQRQVNDARRAFDLARDPRLVFPGGQRHGGEGPKLFRGGPT